eukprot:515164_1
MLEHLKICCIRGIILYLCIYLFDILLFDILLIEGTIPRTAIFYILFYMVFEYRIIVAPTQELALYAIFCILNLNMPLCFYFRRNLINKQILYLFEIQRAIKTKGTNPRTGILCSQIIENILIDGVPTQ